MRLPRRTRHHLVASIMQHTAAMRFGHFTYRRYMVRDFILSPVDHVYRLFTTWGRYAAKRRYCLQFPAEPSRVGKTYRVTVRAGQPSVSLTAAAVLGWHLRQLAAPDAAVYEPVSREEPSRIRRQQWLRDTWSRMLSRAPEVDRQLIQHITPHSFRPGLAGDQWRAHESPRVIMADVEQGADGDVCKKDPIAIEASIERIRIHRVRGKRM